MRCGGERTACTRHIPALSWYLARPAGRRSDHEHGAARAVTAREMGCRHCAAVGERDGAAQARMIVAAGAGWAFYVTNITSGSTPCARSSSYLAPSIGIRISKPKTSRTSARQAGYWRAAHRLGAGAGG